MTRRTYTFAERRWRPAWFSMAVELLLSLGILGLLLRIEFAFVTKQNAQLSTGDWWQALSSGLRFDIASASILTLMTVLISWLLWRLGVRVKAWRWYLLPALMLSYLMQVGDLLYAQESGRHISYEIIEVIHSGDNLLSMLPHYWPHFLALLPLLAYSAWRRMPLSPPGGSPFWQDGKIIFIFVLCGIGIRGGIGDLPLTPGAAFREGSAAVSMVRLNGAYAVIYSAWNHHNKVGLPKMASLPAEQEMQRVHALYSERFSDSEKSAHALRPMNIIMVFLESWPAEIMASYGYDKTPSPQFDALRKQSLTATAMIAGGHRTVEGVFPTFCSYQNIAGLSVGSSQLLNFDYHCLPRVLQENGWSTAFLQGGHRNAADLGDLVSKLGAQHVYGSEDMPATLRYPQNAWGVHDFDLFDFVNHLRSEMSEPYFIGVNTTTTHDETLPPGVEPAFGMDSVLQRQLSTMHFADAALGEFIAKLPQQKSQLPTMVVLVADHTARVNSSNFNHYFIPFAMYAPDIIAAHEVPLAAQRDIAPTIVDLVGIKVDWWAGKSLLQDVPRRFVDYQHNGRTGWLEGDRLIEYSSADASQPVCYQWPNDHLLQTPLACNDDDISRMRDSVAFSHYSAEHLFSGNTKSLISGLKP